MQRVLANKWMAASDRDGLPIKKNFTKERNARVIAEGIDAARARLGCGMLAARSKASHLLG